MNQWERKILHWGYFVSRLQYLEVLIQLSVCVFLGEEDDKMCVIFRLDKLNTSRTLHEYQLLVALVDTT